MKNTNRRPLSQRVSRKEEKIRGQVMKNTNRSTQATQSESEQKRENSCVEEKCEQHCHSVRE